MRPKALALPSNLIRPIAEGHGRCFATDRIVVDRQPIGYMYREEPEDPTDSGWFFFSGDEPDDYVNDAENLGIYDVNTVANYDPSIIPHLSALPGSAFIRDPQSGLLTLDATGDGCFEC